MNKTATYSIVIFFIVSLFLSVSIQSVILVNYAVDQDGYTEKFCKNKENPDSNCHGSCHLSEQLSFASLELKKQQDESLSIVVSIFSFQQIKELPLNYKSLSLKENSFFLKSFINDYLIKSIFKPPCFV